MVSIRVMTADTVTALINDTVVSGTVASNGHLLLTTKGGTTRDAGLVIRPLGDTWSSAKAYLAGDITGYAGLLWKAAADNTNKCPALYTSVWTPITGGDYSDWAERDPNFNGDDYTSNWDVATKTGAPTVALSTTAGEFETGLRSLKITLPASASQSFFQKEENIVRGTQTITATIRVKLTTAVTGLTINAQLRQNDTTGTPTPGATGVTVVNSAEGAQALTSGWQTFTFTFVAGNAKPRANVVFIVTAGTNAAAVVVDRTHVYKAQGNALESWPVGSIYTSISPTNPQTIFGGGTWVAWGSGKVPVGVDAAQTEFATVEQSGGVKTVALVAANLPAHTHTINHGHTAQSRPAVGALTSILAQGGGTDTIVANAAVNDFNGNSGAGPGNSTPVSNLQPYITCYMWKRTA